MLLEGKTAVITGAASGMGRASSILFAAEGAEVVAADLNLAGAEETVKAITDAGGKATAVKVDISDEAQVQSLVRTAIAKYGKIDILFCIAGFPEASMSIADVPLSQVKKIFEVNVFGTWLCCKYAYPEIKKTGKGVILTIGSGAALRPRGGTAAYSASKGAIVTMTKALANEFAPEIRVNCIMPGCTDTPMMKQFAPGYNEQVRDSIAGTLPLKTVAQPEDIAQMGLFLASDLGRKITGVEFLVDCGLSISRGNQ
jgi:3-oxoacyl-[acyl-carrier protein] reductase